jgi:hypothetical protein
MSDDALAEFHQDLVAEVEEGLSPEEPFSDSVFTRLLLERLEEAGQFDGTFPLYQEGVLWIGRFALQVPVSTVSPRSWNPQTPTQAISRALSRTRRRTSWQSASSC